MRHVAGIATASTVSGDLRIGHAGGAATVSTVSGYIQLELAAAAVRANAVSGDVDVRMVPGLALWIDVQSVSGDVSSELDVADAPAGGVGEHVELRVSDDGPGVPAADAERIFQPLVTSSPRPESTGLGLPVAREIAESTPVAPAGS